MTATPGSTDSRKSSRLANMSLGLGGGLLVAILALAAAFGAMRQEVTDHARRLKCVEDAILSIPSIKTDVRWLRRHAENQRDSSPD